MEIYKELKHPESILIKNEYYPNGLTSGKIYNYYLKNKDKIVKSINNNFCILFMVPTTPNKIVVKRKNHDRSIMINRNNYDEIISQKVLSIGVEMSNYSKNIIIDIDADDNTTEKEKKIAVYDLLNYSNSFKDIISYKVLSTSTGYHIDFEIKEITNIDRLRKSVIKNLENKFGDRYYINRRGVSGINFDLSPMYFKAGRIVEHVLNRNGLICMDVTKKLDKFERNDSILK